MITEEFLEFRRAVESCERPGSGHLPEELRARGVMLARRLAEDGECVAAICRALGISRPTARLWSAGVLARDGGSVPMVPVEVVATRPKASSTARPAERRVSVTAPGGYRVDDLTLSEAAALLRALR